MISGSMVLIQPNFLKIINCGINVTCVGIIMVLSKIINVTLFPLARNLAKPYATIDEEISVNTVFAMVRIRLFPSQIGTSLSVKILMKFPISNSWGKIV